MVSPRSLPLLLALLLALAGCSGAPVDDTATPAPVTTPAPVPTETLPGDRIAPGLSPEGVVDADRLRQAHHEHLANRSYRRTTGTVYAFENGTVLLATWYNHSRDPTTHRQLVVNVERGRLAGQSHHYEEWGNRTLLVERITRGDEVRYERRERTRRSVRSHGGSAANLLAESDATVAGKRRANGTTEFVLVARNVSDLNLLQRIDANRSGPTRLVAVVTREGLVRSARITQRGTYRGEPVTVVGRVAITDIGETTVGRPPWLDAALNATADGDAGGNLTAVVTPTPTSVQTAES